MVLICFCNFPNSLFEQEQKPHPQVSIMALIIIIIYRNAEPDLGRRHVSLCHSSQINFQMHCNSLQLGGH